ncbi:isochorismate synthase [Rothia sp. ZJ932]|nr:isochorismate synthase [Rothia sp. ZJ1223]MBM7052038.1 isochorismate synthase [Rothia sp. ZJ1223]QRZ62516.1 isochorismate synthase [Rothia sp. ZJ932]
MPSFYMSTGQESIYSTGTLTPVTEENCLEVATARDSVVMGLVPFDPAQPARLWVPESFERGTLPVTTEKPMPSLASVSGQDNPGYRAAVATAVECMGKGELDKVVLARTLTAEFDAHLHAPDVLDNLRALQPRAYTFSVAIPGTKQYLMGASPELVFSTHDGDFETFPLAGSAPRQTPGSIEDMQTGEELMRSAKDRAEHATVVDDIRRRLTPLVETLEIPATPTLVTTPQLWHLGTRIQGNLAPGISSLQGARAIHPTPAICGTPREEALETIAELEDFDRGFFGGLVGYMDANGNGSWALVLRCALVGEHSATLFAGAGIIKASEPVKEHEETATKLGTFAQALGVTSL